MKRKQLRWDAVTENLFGIQQYRYENSAQQDAKYRRALKLLPKAMEEVLTGRQYDCMYAYYFEHKTQAQIGRELGIGAPTVNKHIQKAKARLYRVMRYSF